VAAALVARLEQAGVEPAPVLALLGELDGVSGKIARAAIEMLPELDRRAGCRLLIPWLDVGVALAEASGATALMVTVREPWLDETWLGRALSADMKPAFAARGIDPCGERGEYHTVVTSCPAFSHPLRVRAIGRATNSGCIAEDLILDEAAS